MSVALETKGQQYWAAVAALERAQRSRAYKHSSRIIYVATALLIFGVRGVVLMDDVRAALASFQLTEAQLKRVLAVGVRAAIAAASDMCSARAAALRCLPKAPRGADGKRVKVHIPQKPFWAGPWRGERGRVW